MQAEPLGGVDELAAEVESQSARLLSVLRALPDPHAVPDGEQRGAATIAMHVAAGHLQAVGWIDGVLHDGVIVDPLDRETIDSINAGYAAEHATPSVDEAAAAVESAASELAAAIRGIGDQRLDTESVSEMLGRQWTLRDLAGVAIRHVRVHTDAVASVAALR